MSNAIGNLDNKVRTMEKTMDRFDAILWNELEWQSAQFEARLKRALSSELLRGSGAPLGHISSRLDQPVLDALKTI